MLPKGEPLTPLSREETKVARQRCIVRLLPCARAHQPSRSIQNPSAICNLQCEVSRWPVVQPWTTKALQNICSNYPVM